MLAGRVGYFGDWAAMARNIPQVVVAVLNSIPRLRATRFYAKCGAKHGKSLARESTVANPPKLPHGLLKSLSTFPMCSMRGDSASPCRETVPHTLPLRGRVSALPFNFRLNSMEQLVYFPLKLTMQVPHAVMKIGSSSTRRIVRNRVQQPTFKFSCESRVFHPAQDKLRLDRLYSEPAKN